MSAYTDVLDMTTAPTTALPVLVPAPRKRSLLDRLTSKAAREEHRNRGRHRRRVYAFITVDVTASGAQVRLPGHMADLWVLMPEEVRDRFRAAADRARDEETWRG